MINILRFFQREVVINTTGHDLWLSDEAMELLKKAKG